ncbi:lantibiotic dehydratase [Streptomyces sp. NPDC048383]|uniref:lantibiotic dehydratase n=1 Tax=Streptomyces sp. NPDC048383 TaxID=3155386 RepID=UPI00341DD6EF
MTSGNYFQTAEPILLRISSLAADGNHSENFRPGRDELPDDEQLISYIQEMAKDDFFRESVAVSSTSLASALDKVQRRAAMSRKNLLSAAVSLTRYFLRITGRPTPFGLHAGVAEVRTGDRARAVFTGTAQKAVRLDAGWLAGAADSWLALPAVRRSVDVMANDLCAVRGDRLVLPYVTASPAGDAPGAAQTTGQELSLRETALTAWIRDRARTPLKYGALLADAVEAFPAADEERLDQLLLSLVRSEILLTSLSPRLIDEEFLARTMTALGPSSDEAARLRAVLSALEDYRSAPPGDGTGAWTALEDVGRAVHRDGRSVAQVDLRSPAEVELPRGVLDEAEAYATALWRIAPEDKAHRRMRAYYEAFVEKYGEGIAVRLPDLIDPHRGLGYPGGYLNPRVSRDPRLYVHEQALEAEGPGDRLEHLASLIQRGVLSSDRELVLGDEDITRLTVESRPSALPHSLDLCFQLLADSTDGIDAGDFRLLASPMIGAGLAGATTARFASVSGTEQAVARLVNPGEDEDVITAQLVFRPQIPRLLNVVQVPELTRYDIPVGAFPAGTGSRHIDWRALVVTADGERLRLLLPDSGREVRPVVPHMLSMSSVAPNLARFLGELRFTGERKVWQPWDWAGYGLSPWQPRVRIGKVVASPLTWRPSPEMRHLTGRRDDWERAVERWRREVRVDDQVTVVSGDKTYGIDLRDAFHREILRRDLTREELVLTETPQALGFGHGWSAGRSNEICVPLVACAPRPTYVPAATPAIGVVEHHPVGGLWTSVHVQAVLEAHDALVRGLGDLAEAVADSVDRWFYLRYFSPEPHLRLRLRSPDEASASAVRRAVQDHLYRAREAGLLREFSTQAYEPETTRYGGPRALDAAEEVFCRDSRTAVAQLALLGSGRSPVPRDLMMCAGHAVLLESLGDWDWQSWAARQFPKSTDGSITRGDVEAAARLIQPGRTAANLAAACGIPGIETLWREPSRLGRELDLSGDAGHRADRRRDTALVSLLHMQHNRLIGNNLASESRAVVLLGHVARQQLGRARNGKAKS